MTFALAATPGASNMALAAFCVGAGASGSAGRLASDVGVFAPIFSRGFGSAREAALAAAERLDPNFVDTYVYRGIVYFKTGQLLNAVQEYQHALKIEPGNEQASKYLAIAIGQLRK